MYTQLIWGKGVIVTCKKDCTFFKVGFYWQFSQQAKVPRFGEVFHLANFFDLTYVSVQVILFPLNLVSTESQGFFNFFGMEN